MLSYVDMLTCTYIFSYSNGQPPPPGLCEENPSPRLSNYTKCCGNSGITYESNTKGVRCCQGKICTIRNFKCINQYCRSQQVSIN